MSAGVRNVRQRQSLCRSRWSHRVAHPKSTSSLNSQAICLNLFQSSASQPIPSPTKQSLNVNILRNHNCLLNLRDSMIKRVDFSLPQRVETVHLVRRVLGILVDPPRDVYGKLRLTSPKEALLTIAFRPPASHPHLIHNFTFFFSHNNETIVHVVVKDKVSLSSSFLSAFSSKSRPLRALVFANCFATPHTQRLRGGLWVVGRMGMEKTLQPGDVMKQ